MIEVPKHAVEKCISDIFISHGLNVEDSKIVSDGIVWAEVAGKDSHGINRIPFYLNKLESGRLSKCGRIRVKYLSDSAIAIDGQSNLGINVMTKSLPFLVAACRRNSVCLGFYSNSSNFGAGSFYSYKLAKLGLISLILSNTTPRVKVGNSSILGTNPISIGYPTSDGSGLFLDLSTTNFSYGKLELLHTKDELERVPLNDNPSLRFMDFNSLKGFALSCAIDLLSGYLTNADFGPNVNKSEQDNTGHLVLLINPQRLVGERKTADHWLNILSNAIPPEMRLPGSTTRSNSEQDLVTLNSKNLSILKEYGFEI